MRTLLIALFVCWATSMGVQAASQVEASAGKGGDVLGGESTAQVQFEAANAAYREGAFDDARLRWEELFAHPALSDRDRSRVAMSLGNLAWRTEREMESIGWYTLATRLDGRNADARTNLEHARAEQGLEPDDRGDLRSTLLRLVAWPRPAERRWAVLGSLLLLALALLGEALRGGSFWRRLSLTSALVFGLACVPWLFGMLPREADTFLVIDAPALTMRSEPRSGVGSTGEVRAGETVERIDELAGWIRVRTDGGRRGWVQAAGLFALER